MYLLLFNTTSSWASDASRLPVSWDSSRIYNRDTDVRVPIRCTHVNDYMPLPIVLIVTSEHACTTEEQGPDANADQNDLEHTTNRNAENSEIDKIFLLYWILG
jgi:hypothetical protein